MMKFQLLLIVFLLLIELSSCSPIPKKKWVSKSLRLNSLVRSDPTSWIRSTFEGLEPCSYLKKPCSVEEDKLNDRFCIMNDAEYSMNIPLIDFNPKAYAEDICNECNEKPDARKKVLHATLRGSGGGKTRALEEIRRELLYMEDVLPLAITYNSDWPIGNEEWGDKVDQDLFYALSLVSRMASMFYEIELSDIKLRMMKDDSIFPQLKSYQLIQAFVSHMVESLSTYRKISKFILLTDESAAMQARIEEKFNDYNDITSIVREALLSKEIQVEREGSQERLNVSLVISSLTLLPIGRTISNRYVTPIVLPGRLDTMKVVRDIWEIDKDETKELFKKYELIAASMNELPRLIEFANDFIKKNTVNRSSAVYANELYQDVISSTRKAYFPREGLPRTPVLYKLLYSIVYGEEVNLDKHVQVSVIKSLVTNSLNYFSKEKNIIPSFVPETSLIMLSLAIEEKVPYMYNSLMKIIDSMINCNESSIGNVLETTFEVWMDIKLELSRKNAVQNFTVQTLFGLEDLSGINRGYRYLFKRPIDMEDAKYGAIDLGVSSYKNQTSAFLDRLKSVEVDEDCPFKLLRPMKGESFDVGLKIFIGDKPLYLFFDLKSKREPLPSKDKFIIDKESKLPGNGNQYLHMKREMNKTDLDFIYVYVTTDNVESFLSKKHKHVCVLGRDETFAFLGPISNYYKVARSMYNNKKKM